MLADSLDNVDDEKNLCLQKDIVESFSQFNFGHSRHPAVRWTSTHEVDQNRL